MISLWVVRNVAFSPSAGSGLYLNLLIPSYCTDPMWQIYDAVSVFSLKDRIHRFSYENIDKPRHALSFLLMVDQLYIITDNINEIM